MQGGLRVLDLEVMNTSLLAKWFFIFHDPQMQGLWKIILVAKCGYTTHYPSNVSSFWLGVLSTQCFIDISIDKIVGNEKNVKFWTDRWFLNVSFARKYPTLFSITTHPHILVDIIFKAQHLHLHFNYTLDGKYPREWQELSTILQHFFPQHNVQNIIRFRWTPLSMFTVHAMYQWL
jgi:hypothetical protein